MAVKALKALPIHDIAWLKETWRNTRFSGVPRRQTGYLLVVEHQDKLVLKNKQLQLTVMNRW